MIDYNKLIAVKLSNVFLELSQQRKIILEQKFHKKR